MVLASSALRALLGAIAIAATLWLGAKQRQIAKHDVRRIAARVSVYAVGVVLWPILLICICPSCLSGHPLTLLSGLLVMFVLEEEVASLARYSGPLKDYDPMERAQKQSIHIAASAFAAGAFVSSFKQNKLSEQAGAMIILAMALSLLASVPSHVVMQNRKQNATFEALYKLASSYSIGLLFTALFFVLDVLLKARA